MRAHDLNISQNLYLLIPPHLGVKFSTYGFDGTHSDHRGNHFYSSCLERKYEDMSSEVELVPR